MVAEKPYVDKADHGEMLAIIIDQLETKCARLTERINKLEVHGFRMKRMILELRKGKGRKR